MDIDTFVETFHPLFESIWEEDEMAEDWREEYLVKLHKKGDLSNCVHYRGITLLSVPRKVFNRIILDRMQDAVDPQLKGHLGTI